ncbi:ORF1.5 [Opuntia umbra-like virus]|nr:ORF1.5 [Opuntia umbra-like virus]
MDLNETHGYSSLWAQARKVLRAPASFTHSVVRAAHAWVRQQRSKNAIQLSEALGIILGNKVEGLLKRLPNPRRVAEKLVVSKGIDTLVDDWCSGHSNPATPEVGWALRLRDRFGLPPASEPTRLSGERWVLKQLNGVDPESWNAELRDEIAIQGIYAPGENAQIAAAAATLWLTPTFRDEAWSKHQGFHSLQ